MKSVVRCLKESLMSYIYLDVHLQPLSEEQRQERKHRVDRADAEIALRYNYSIILILREITPIP